MRQVSDVIFMAVLLLLTLLTPNLSYAQYEFSSEEVEEMQPVANDDSGESKIVKTKVKLKASQHNKEIILDSANDLLDKSVDMLTQAEKLIEQGYRSLATALLSEVIQSAKRAAEKAKELHELGGPENVYESKKINSQADGLVNKARQLAGGKKPHEA